MQASYCRVLPQEPDKQVRVSSLYYRAEDCIVWSAGNDVVKEYCMLSPGGWSNTRR